MKKWVSMAMGCLAIGACETTISVNGDSTFMPDSEISYVATGWTAKTLPELSEALTTGEISAAALTSEYLARIDQIDRSGPALQAILKVNPDALSQAEMSDTRRAAGESLGPLDGIPILLKDNIETLDPMATTAGALVLKDNVTGRDSPLVAGLRAQGAIILGKTNLSQWANFRSNDSISGWSALGGQVRNPHMLDRSPCGSSSGSGAAAAASLAAGTVGTETNGSIICPSNVNGIVGFKPTVGLVGQKYIVPISHSQDTAGPMTKSVKGAAMMLNAMADGSEKTDYVAALAGDALAGKRIGVLRFSEGSNGDIKGHFNSALKVLEDQGATLVEIETFDLAGDNFWGDSLSVLEFEYKAGLDHYMAEAAPDVPARSLEEIISFNEANAEIELALFDQSLMHSSQAKGSLRDPDYLKALSAVQSATRENGIDKLLVENSVDMLVSPSGPISPRVDPVNGDVWPDWAGAGYLAAIAGYPHITVPMGNVHGIPVGLSIMGAKNEDAAILAYGYAYEQASQKRVDPQYLKTAEDRPEIAAASIVDKP